MKKAIFPLALALCVFVSCKKSNPSSGPANSGSSNTYHLTANIDGKAQNFNFNLLADDTVILSQTQITIQGYTGTSGDNVQLFGLAWTNQSADTFSLGTWSDTSTQYTTVGIYYPNNADLNNAYESGTNITGQASRDGFTVNHFKLIITAKDSKTVTGTFSGDFYYQGLVSGGEKKTIYGDFYARWK